MLDAENIRLMYVATTRARDHLVLSLLRTEKDGKDTPAGQISSLMSDRPDLWETFVMAPSAAHASVGDATGGGSNGSSPADHSLEARDHWLSEREAMLTDMGRPSSASATSLGRSTGESQDGKEEQESEEPWRRGRGGTQVGRAVHAVLQATDLASGHDIADRARAQAVAEGVPDRATEIESLATTAVASEAVKRAVASGRLWREVPVAVPVGGGSLHGFIDLLFEERDGLVVVDYKTDSISESQAQEAVNRYRLQGGAYAYAVEQLTGKRVKEVVFLYLQPNREERLPDLQQAMEDARSEAESLLGAGAN